MTEPIVTSTGYSMLTQDQLLTEVQRLEGLVASLAAERDHEHLAMLKMAMKNAEKILRLTEQRDSARDIACRSGYFERITGDEDREVLRAQETRPDRPLTDEEPAADRPSAYDMPVGTYIFGHDYDGDHRSWVRDSAHPGGWMDESSGKGGIQSGWIEGLFSDGLVTEWRLP